MAGQPDDQGESADAQEQYRQFMKERKELTDAARESSRTFDKAILAFGSAVFGASVAFLKDVAPNPQRYTLLWLGIAWTCFIVGLLAVLLSFLFSHRACLARIDECANRLQNPNAPTPIDFWGTLTTIANWTCVALLFLGVGAWTVFALQNLAVKGRTNAEQTSSSTTTRGDKEGIRAAESASPQTNAVNVNCYPAAAATKEMR